MLQCTPTWLHSRGMANGKVTYVSILNTEDTFSSKETKVRTIGHSTAHMHHEWIDVVEERMEKGANKA